MEPRDSFVRVSCECVCRYYDSIFADFVLLSSQEGGDSRLGRLSRFYWNFSKVYKKTIN